MHDWARPEEQHDTQLTRTCWSSVTVTRRARQDNMTRPPGFAGRTRWCVSRPRAATTPSVVAERTCGGTSLAAQPGLSSSIIIAAGAHRALFFPFRGLRCFLSLPSWPLFGRCMRVSGRCWYVSIDDVRSRVRLLSANFPSSRAEACGRARGSLHILSVQCDLCKHVDVVLLLPASSPLVLSCSETKMMQEWRHQRRSLAD
jgi:hypothetical protein